MHGFLKSLVSFFSIKYDFSLFYPRNRISTNTVNLKNLTIFSIFHLTLKDCNAN